MHFVCFLGRYLLIVLYVDNTKSLYLWRDFGRIYPCGLLEVRGNGVFVILLQLVICTLVRLIVEDLFKPHSRRQHQR